MDSFRCILRLDIVLLKIKTKPRGKSDYNEKAEQIMHSSSRGHLEADKKDFLRSNEMVAEQGANVCVLDDERNRQGKISNNIQEL